MRTADCPCGERLVCVEPTMPGTKNHLTDEALERMIAEAIERHRPACIDPDW